MTWASSQDLSPAISFLLGSYVSPNMDPSHNVKSEILHLCLKYGQSWVTAILLCNTGLSDLHDLYPYSLHLTVTLEAGLLVCTLPGLWRGREGKTQALGSTRTPSGAKKLSGDSLKQELAGSRRHHRIPSGIKSVQKVNLKIT